MVQGEESIHYIHRTVFVPTSPSRSSSHSSGSSHPYNRSKQQQQEETSNIIHQTHPIKEDEWNSPTNTTRLDGDGSMVQQQQQQQQKQQQQHHHHQHEQPQQSIGVMTSPVKKEKRKIVIQSLVCDSLSVIAESSEHSESSISTYERMSPQHHHQQQQEQLKANRNRNYSNDSNKGGPHHARSSNTSVNTSNTSNIEKRSNRPKRRPRKVDQSASDEKSSGSNNSSSNTNGNERNTKQNGVHQHQQLPPSIAEDSVVEHDYSHGDDEESIKILDEDHTTDTEKSTKSDHSAEQDSRQSGTGSCGSHRNSNVPVDPNDDNDEDDYEEDSLDNSSNSYSKGDGSSKSGQNGLTSLANYLKPLHGTVGKNGYNAQMDVSNMNMMNLSASELVTLDGDNSAMMFSYDVDETDEDNSLNNNSKHSSLGGLRRLNDDEEELSWRLDPSISMSDWTIVITYKSSKNVEQYYVHKNMLAVGKRKSEYFAEIFHQHYKAGSRTNCTEITLPDRAAQIIPMFLDYMYLDEGALTLSSETAPGLRYLSQFFGIKVLFERVMKFIQKDLSLKSLVSYYRGSVDLADRKILGITARHCARNIHLVDVSHPMLEAMDPDFFYKVLSNPALAPDKSMHISLLVAKYCLMHKDRLNGNLFVNLTSPEYIPQIHHTAALSLLSMEADLVVATSLISYMTMSTLQERCIKGLASNWRELTELDPMRTAQVCRKLPSVVVTELLLKSLDHAKTDSNRQSATRVLIRKGSGKSKPNEEMSAIKKEYQDSVERLKVEYESKTAHLQQLCYEKDKHIKSYYEELSRYQRLPNAPDGKLAASGRSIQPTKMPEIGKHSVDGYVLSSKKKDGPKYPVFYYKSDCS